MKKLQKQWWKPFVFPHWFIKFILVIASTILLIYSLGYQDANPIIAYISYALSAYTLVIVMLRVPTMVKCIKRILYANKYSGKYLSEPELRARISLYSSGAINIVYALLKLIAGIYYRSIWLGAIAIYYIVLSLIRMGLIRQERKCMLFADVKKRRRFELKSSHFCGCLMFLLNIAVTGLVIQMIWQNKYYDYPGFLIYAQAAFAFYCLTKAIINIVKYRKMERPILSAAKIVSMSCALMSILALQTAMLMTFGQDQMNFARLMNSLTGAAVCFLVFAMAVWLVHKTRAEIRLLKD